MRFIGTKAAAVAMITAAALTVTACGRGNDTDAVDTTNVTEMGEEVIMEGTTNDMTTIDSAIDTTVETDPNMMGDNSTMTNSAGGMTGNVTGNGM